MDVVLAWGNFGLSEEQAVDKVRLAGNAKSGRECCEWQELDQGRGADAVHDPGPVGCEGRGKGGRRERRSTEHRECMASGEHGCQASDARGTTDLACIQRR